MLPEEASASENGILEPFRNGHRRPHPLRAPGWQFNLIKKGQNKEPKLILENDMYKLLEVYTISSINGPQKEPEKEKCPLNCHPDQPPERTPNTPPAVENPAPRRIFQHIFWERYLLSGHGSSVRLRHVSPSLRRDRHRRSEVSGAY